MKTRKPTTKSIKNCDLAELEQSPMNLYIYAVTVLNDRLPEKQHAMMEIWKKEKTNEYANGYFDFLKTKNNFWSKLKFWCKNEK